MAKTKPIVLPRLEGILTELGENIRLARLRRRLSSQQLAERAGISRSTMINIEKGHPGVSMGYFLNVLQVLGLENDLRLVARDDELGRKIQDAGLITRKRSPKRKRI